MLFVYNSFMIRIGRLLTSLNFLLYSSFCGIININVILENNSDVNSSNSKAQNVTSRFTYVSPIASTNNNKYAKLYNANLKADENDSRYYGSGEYIFQDLLLFYLDFIL